MLELLFLLLPIAALYGWIMGRNSTRQELKKEQEQFSKKYVTGLNLLLSEQSDKAIDAFIDMLDVDEETVETHWTLGSLFRRRGEIDRAIRIHTNLIETFQLDIQQRDQASLELAKDYLAAGFYDRAEATLSALVKGHHVKQESEQLLLQIYESTNDWQQAIKVALSMRPTQENITARVAHYLCELAEQASDNEMRLNYLQAALEHDPTSIRARIELAQQCQENEDYAGILNLLLPVLENAPDFTSEAISLVEFAYQAMKKETEFVHLLRRLSLISSQSSVITLLSDYIEKSEGPETAEQFMRASLRSKPTLKGFKKLINLHIARAAPGRERSSLELIRELVSEQLKQTMNYRCSHCGFSGKKLYWHCPSCKEWGTTKPTQGLNG